MRSLFFMKNLLTCPFLAVSIFKFELKPRAFQSEGMLNIMKLIQAQLKDKNTIMTILRDGSRQLAKQGIDQWQGDYPNETQVLADIQAGHSYLYQTDAGQTVGSIAVAPSPDSSYDTLEGSWLVNTDSFAVIHRVAVLSECTGHGYATTLLQSGINLIQAKHPHAASVRIDTHQHNQAMQHLINKLGFNQVGQISGVYTDADVSFVYEKPIRQLVGIAR